MPWTGHSHSKFIFMHYSLHCLSQVVPCNTQGRRHQSGWSGFNLTTFQVKVCIEERGTIVAQAQKIIRLSPPAQARK